VRSGRMGISRLLRKRIGLTLDTTHAVKSSTPSYAGGYDWRSKTPARRWCGIRGVRALSHFQIWETTNGGRWPVWRPATCALILSILAPGQQHTMKTVIGVAAIQGSSQLPVEHFNQGRFPAAAGKHERLLAGKKPHFRGV